MFGAVVASAETFIGGKVLSTHSFIHAIEQIRSGGSDVDVPIQCRKYACRRAGRVVIARLRGDFAFDEPARALEVEHLNDRF